MNLTHVIHDLSFGDLDSAAQIASLDSHVKNPLAGTKRIPPAKERSRDLLSCVLSYWTCSTPLCLVVEEGVWDASEVPRVLSLSCLCVCVFLVLQHSHPHKRWHTYTHARVPWQRPLLFRMYVWVHVC